MFPALLKQPRLVEAQLKDIRHRIRRNKSTLRHFNRMAKSATEARKLYDKHNCPRVYAIRPGDDGLLEHRRGDIPSSVIRDLEVTSELLIGLHRVQRTVHDQLLGLHKSGFRRQGDYVREKVQEQDELERFVLEEAKRVEAESERRLMEIGCGSFVVRRKQKKRDGRRGNGCEALCVPIIVLIALGAMGTLCFLANLYCQSLVCHT
ncbi:hypothetical protein GGR57DRAFT_500697 [Xylariaceae sp. FL1272]|nr:hypothetical protein GGR57DRAFT_500697 [Xylariaceae sp. FL1272]